MRNKKIARLRRAQHTRMKIRQLGVPRLSVHRTPRHIYAQIIGPGGGETMASASTTDTALRAKLKHSGNMSAAKLVGQSIAEKAQVAGIKKVAFDRSGFKYHGRVKALADAARENGLQF